MKAALVTGGSRRIGRAIVLDLARHGWAVAIHANQSHAAADELAMEIRAAGGRAAVVQCDLADIEAVRGLIAQATDALGPLDLLVNNAAIFEPDAFGSLDPALWRRQMTINLEAPVFLAQAFAASLPADVEGSIVNLVDQRVWKPLPHFVSYQLSKVGLWSATQAMAQAFAPRIRVNAIGPGPVLPSTRQQQEDFDRLVATLPLRRGPGLDEFGRTIRFLAETPSITGQMIALDGGQHLAWETPDVVGIPE